MEAKYRVYFKDGDLVKESNSAQDIGIYMLGRSLDYYIVKKYNVVHPRTMGCDISRYIQELRDFDPEYIDNELFEI